MMRDAARTLIKQERHAAKDSAVRQALWPNSSRGTAANSASA